MQRNERSRQLTVDISRFQPVLDRDGILTLQVNTFDGPVFHPEYARYLHDTLGEPQAEQAMDAAADKLFKHTVIHDMLENQTGPL